MHFQRQSVCKFRVILCALAVIGVWGSTTDVFAGTVSANLHVSARVVDRCTVVLPNWHAERLINSGRRLPMPSVNCSATKNRSWHVIEGRHGTVSLRSRLGGRLEEKHGQKPTKHDLVSEPYHHRVYVVTVTY